MDTSNPMQQVAAALAAGRLILLDGATGTELQRRGAAMHDTAWCAAATLTDPDLLLAVHRDYILAGADVITTNTFSTNRWMLEAAGLGAQLSEINRRAVAIARAARTQAAVDRPVVIAGSLSHQVPVIAGTDFRDPAAVPGRRTAAADFAEIATILAAAGVDLLLLEMMSDPDLALPALEAAAATGLPLWVGLSARLEADGRLVSYHRRELSFAEVAATIIGAGGGSAYGIMHTPVAAIAPCLAIIRRHWSGPLMAYPDSGVFRMPHWLFEDIIAPNHLARLARQWRNSFGIGILGGCCGLGPEHIRELAGLKDNGD